MLHLVGQESGLEGILEVIRPDRRTDEDTEPRGVVTYPVAQSNRDKAKP